MDRTQRIIFYILTLLAGAAWIAISAGAGPVDAGTPAPQAGFPAPDFTLKDSAGNSHSLSGMDGQAVLVNLWATWCPPCEAEMPAIEAVYNEYKDQGFTVLAINQTYQDNPFDIAPFIKEHSLSFPVLLDETGETAQAYHVHYLPASFFVNRSGKITEAVIGGPMPEALLRTRIEEALK